MSTDSGNLSFKENIIATSADHALDVHIADLDSDGDLDIVSASHAFAIGSTGTGDDRIRLTV